MTRLERFNSYESHPWLKKVYKKLKASDREICSQFIKKHDALNKNDFEILINRMFLNDQNKSQNWKLILELLSCCNN
jgi:hypothetical protein